MSILNTARSIYADNDKASMIGSLGKASKAHFLAAVHPTNMIGKAFGHGSFVHSKASRILGAPKYLPGGVKNYAKSSIKGGGIGGSKSSPRNTPASARTPITGDIEQTQVKQLGVIEDNTGQTVTLLTNLVDGDKKAAFQADIKANLDEEKTKEQNRLFETLGEKLEKLSVNPSGKTSDVKGGGAGGFLSTLLGSFGGTALAGLGGMILSGVGTAISTIFSGLMAGGGLLLGAGRLFASIGGLGLALMASVVSGLYSGIKEYMKSGDIQKSIEAGLSGMTFGLLSPEFIRNNVLQPICNAIDTVIASITSMFTGLGNWIAAHNPFGSTTTSPETVVLPLAPSARAPDAPRRPGEKTTRHNIHRPATTEIKPQTSTWGMLTDTREGTLWNSLGFGSAEPAAPNAKGTKPAPTAAPSYTAGGRAGFSESGIPPEGMNLLDSIAGSESPDYNTINGGKKFTDMSDHPFAATNRDKGYGLAAGRYQFMPATWNEYKAKLGLPDFSPQSQDIAAWQLAQDRYAANTKGRNLQLDLADPNNALRIGNALRGTWTSLPGGAEWNSQTDSFAARLTGGKSSGGGGGSMAYAAMSAAPKFNVPSATAATAESGRAVGAATQDMSNLAPASYISQTIVNHQADQGTADKAMSPTGSGEAVDDIISKILVAMGVVVAT